MRLYKYTLAAGAEQTITARGRFIRGMSASERYKVQVDNGARTDFETGIAFELPNEFSQVRLINTAAVSQVIEIAISQRPVFDNRLVGTMDLNGAIGILTTASASHNTPAKQSITVSTQVLAANADRRSALVQIDGACYVDNSLDGVLIPAGSMVWESQTALVLVPSAGTVVVRILEESNV